MKTGVTAFLRLASLCLVLAGCKDYSPVQAPILHGLPSQFRLQGEAKGNDAAGLEADCLINFIFELRQETERSESLVAYRGIHGGEANRKVLSKNGSGFSFFIDVFGEVEAEVEPFTGTMRIRIPVNETAESRFYQLLSRFEGTVDAAGNGSGIWACGPLDIDQGGYLDNSVRAYGTWHIEPIAP